jgi:hypothetical protein
MTQQVLGKLERIITDLTEDTLDTSKESSDAG